MVSLFYLQPPKDRFGGLENLKLGVYQVNFKVSSYHAPAAIE